MNNSLRICQGCGIEFDPARANQAYHSPACKQKSYRQRNGATEQRGRPVMRPASLTDQLVQEYGRITMLTQGSGKRLPNGLMQVRNIDYGALHRERWDIHIRLAKLGLRAMLTCNGWVAAPDYSVTDYFEDDRDTTDG